MARGSSRDAVRSAYRRAARRWHPDRFGSDASTQQFALERMKEINAAYSTLKHALVAEAHRRQARRRAIPRLVMAVFFVLCAATTAWHAKGYLEDRDAAPARDDATAIRAAASAAPDVTPGPPIVRDTSAPTELPDPVHVPTTEPPPDLRFFQHGSPRADVVALHGDPDRVEDGVAWWGTSSVTFESGRVRGWSSRSPRLKVLMLPRRTTGKKRFSVGATVDTVIGIHGTPDEFAADRLRYGRSVVWLDRKGLRPGAYRRFKVADWNVADRPLRVLRLPGTFGRLVAFAAPRPRDATALQR